MRPWSKPIPAPLIELLLRPEAFDLDEPRGPAFLRILFVAFAEDRGLLDNSGKILENTAALRAFRRSKWNNFQALFEAIDQGDPPHDIPQYNGELFKPDDILDDPKLQLDDKWPTVFTQIGKYDFKDEVTEAILGRIFELSIDDIERILHPCRGSYHELSMVPHSSPHARFDIQDWTPLDP